MFLISQWPHKFNLTCCKIQYIVLVHYIYVQKLHTFINKYSFGKQNIPSYISLKTEQISLLIHWNVFSFLFLLWKLQFTLQLIVFWWFTVYDGMKSNKLKDCLKTITHHQHSSASNGTFRIGHSTFLLTSVM